MMTTEEEEEEVHVSGVADLTMVENSLSEHDFSMEKTFPHDTNDVCNSISDNREAGKSCIGLLFVLLFLDDGWEDNAELEQSS